MTKRKLARRTAGTLLIVVIFGAGYFVGHFGRVVPTDNGHRLQFLTGQSTDKPEDVDFSRFWTAWDIAEQGFYGRNDKTDRVDGAIAGLLSSLKDPYTVYLPKEENQLFQTDLAGSFSGIGAEISQINGFPTVVAPLSSSPAERAGLKPKDVILKVDGKDTENENFAAVINRIRGAIGSIVTVTIAREGESKPLEFKITRAKIEVPNVLGSVQTSGEFKYCLVKINEFIAETDRKTVAALDSCQKQGVDRAVIDLRNNPGGLLDVTVSLAGRLIDTTSKSEYKGMIVWQQDRDGKMTGYPADTKPTLTNWRLVVLVNEGSASASEILSGALKDYGRAKLVGMKTFGKGSVQELRDLSDGSSIKLTVAKWLTPNRTEIDHQGINPDVEVKPAADATEAKDNQLDAAVSVLQSL